MRYIILVSALVALAPVAFAQTGTGKKGTAGATSAATEAPPAGYTVRAPDPNNCGTPDEPRPCSSHRASSGHAAKKTSGS
jgi:hypothetical protein